MSDAKRLTREALFVLALGLGAAGCGRGSGNARMHLDYRVTPTPGAGFEVELTARGLGPHPVFRLLDGWGLLQDQPGHVEAVAAADSRGRPIPVTRGAEAGETRWRLERSADPVRLTYRVEPYPRDVSPEASFVDRNRLVLVGYSIFLLPGAADLDLPIDARVAVEGPGGWRRWSSWPEGEGAYRPGTPHDLWSGMVAAGDFASSRMASGPVAVTVLTEDTATRPLGLTVANRIFPVLRAMNDLFGSPPRGDSLNVVALYRTMSPQPGRSIMTGTSEEGAFLCLATPDRFDDPTPLTALAAHECVHFYLGGAVTADAEPPYRNAPDMIWLMEGMTEYLSYRLMERAGVMSPAQVAAVAARKEREYRETPGWNALTLADAARRMDDMDVYRLVYSRGYLVSRMLDRELESRCGPGALDRVLRTLFEEHDFYRTHRPLTPFEAREAFERVCPGAGALIDRYALRNTTLPAPGKGPAAVETSQRLEPASTTSS